MFKPNLNTLLLKWILLLASVCHSINISAQANFMHDAILVENIKSVELYRKGWKMSPPIVNLQSDDRLELSFDDLNDEVANYYYTIYQCNAQWEESELSQQEYLTGFYENPITDYQFSTNTTVPYTHYTLSLPNEDINWNKSGNYVILVYKDYNKEDIVFTKKFYVYEPLVDIFATAKRPTSATHFIEGQEIDISIDHEGLDINDPFVEIKTVVLQNLDWNFRIEDLKPTFVKNNELVYDYNNENIFSGNSEFRYFDIKSIRYMSEYIQTIEYDHRNYHVLLKEDEERHYGKYFYNDDINGRYMVDVQEYRDAEIESDYVWVYFTLPFPAPLVHADVYVYGSLTNRQTNERSKMEYNFETKSYEKKLFLKQGYYNYCYAIYDKDKQEIDLSYIEGSHFETENDYYIMVYQKPFHLRYDRLIGIKHINSVRPTSE